MTTASTVAVEYSNESPPGAWNRTVVSMVQHALGLEAELLEGLPCEDAGAVHGLANDGMLFEQGHIVTRAGEPPASHQAGRPAAHNHHVADWHHIDQVSVRDTAPAMSRATV